MVSVTVDVVVSVGTGLGVNWLQMLGLKMPSPVDIIGLLDMDVVIDNSEVEGAL